MRLQHALARLGALGSLLVATTGCGHMVSRPPSLDYAEPAPLVDVRFAEEPFQLELVRSVNENETVVARCATRCRLQVPSGLYFLRAQGDAPTAERKLDLKHATRIMVTPGSTPGRVVGISMIASGGLASLGLPIAALAGPLADRQDSTPGVLAVVGLSGLVVLVTGIIVNRTSRTTIDVEQLDERLPETTYKGD